MSGMAVQRPHSVVYVVLAIAVFASVWLGLRVGRGGEAGAALDEVFLTMRANRVVVAFLCGASLSAAGVVVQALFHNPLASPWILGTTSGATLGAHVALLGVALALGDYSTVGVVPEMIVPFGAVLGAGLSLFALLSLVSFRSGPLTLLLTGFAFQMLFVGFGSFLSNYFQEAWELNRAVSALQYGNVSGAGIRQALLSLIMVLGGTLPLLFASPTLDVLLSGDEEAESLGVNVKRARVWLVTWVALSTAGAVAVGGAVATVGLIVPHALRPFVGQRHRYLMPLSFASGGVFIVLCDVAVRALPTRAEVPLGVLVDLLAAPLFLRLLVQLSRAEEERA
jgi:iron complex transport system permease protein